MGENCSVPCCGAAHDRLPFTAVFRNRATCAHAVFHWIQLCICNIISGTNMHMRGAMRSVRRGGSMCRNTHAIATTWQIKPHFDWFFDTELHYNTSAPSLPAKHSHYTANITWFSHNNNNTLVIWFAETSGAQIVFNFPSVVNLQWDGSVTHV